MVQSPSPLKTILEPLQGGLVVSCQAPAHSPLHHPQVIAAMAAAALSQGAVGVRIDSPSHIEAVRALIPDPARGPIIGLWKQVLPPSAVYITPQCHHAEAVALVGSDIIAVDATQRPRPGGETLPQLIQYIRDRLGKPVMADVDTLDNALRAIDAGADCVGTTLFGYTEATADQTPPGFDLLATLVNRCSIPVLCEGGIASPAQVRQAVELGAYAVVVGTAITGIDSLVQRYVSSLPSYPGNG
jgi:N-acylglucosamine-6-phosphate 2-epimerase